MRQGRGLGVAPKLVLQSVSISQSCSSCCLRAEVMLPCDEVEALLLSWVDLSAHLLRAAHFHNFVPSPP